MTTKWSGGNSKPTVTQLHIFTIVVVVFLFLVWYFKDTGICYISFTISHLSVLFLFHTFNHASVVAVAVSVCMYMSFLFILSFGFQTVKQLTHTHTEQVATNWKSFIWKKKLFVANFHIFYILSTIQRKPPTPSCPFHMSV